MFFFHNKLDEEHRQVYHDEIVFYEETQEDEARDKLNKEES